MHTSGADRLLQQLPKLLVGLMIVLATIGIAASAGLYWDFANYYDAGHKVRVGQFDDLYNPHALIEGKPAQSTMAFAAAPISAFLYAPISALPPQVALRVFKLAGTIAYAVALVLLFRHCTQYVTGYRRVWYANAFLVSCLFFQPIWTFYRVGGQTTPFVFLLLVLSLTAFLRERYYFCVCCLIPVVLMKPGFSPLVAFVALTGGMRLMTPLAISSGIALAVSVAIMGVYPHQQFMEALAFHSRNAVNWPFNSALTVMFDNLRVTPSIAPDDQLLVALSMALRGIVAMLFAFTIWKLHKVEGISNAARRHASFLLSVSFGVLVVPVAFEHYPALLFIPLAYFVATFRGWGLILTAAVIVIAFGQNLMIISWMAARVKPASVAGLVAIGMWKALPLYLMTALLLIFAQQLFESYSQAPWIAEKTPDRAKRAATS